MEVDLHGYHPSDIEAGLLSQIAKQAWELGQTGLRLIHGHGYYRGNRPGFVNTKTGLFGLAIRRALRHDPELRTWIKHSTINCSDWGMTSVRLKSNPAPSRTELDHDIKNAFQRLVLCS
jgi:hypothetical protein